MPVSTKEGQQQAETRNPASENVVSRSTSERVRDLLVDTPPQKQGLETRLVKRLERRSNAFSWHGSVPCGRMCNKASARADPESSRVQQQEQAPEDRFRERGFDKYLVNDGIAGCFRCTKGVYSMYFLSITQQVSWVGRSRQTLAAANAPSYHFTIRLGRSHARDLISSGGGGSSIPWGHQLRCGAHGGIDAHTVRF